MTVVPVRPQFVDHNLRYCMPATLLSFWHEAVALMERKLRALTLSGARCVCTPTLDAFTTLQRSLSREQERLRSQHEAVDEVVAPPLRS